MPDQHFLCRCALDALRGVGDSDLGQWEEWSGVAYHIRRRLSADEQCLVGDVIDVRGTPDADRRRAEVRQFLPAHMRNWIE